MESRQMDFGELIDYSLLQGWLERMSERAGVKAGSQVPPKQ